MACLPENPPAPIYLGDLHILDYFARVAERDRRRPPARLRAPGHLPAHEGHAPLTGLDGFPLDRVVELHVAGGVERDDDGFAWIEDDHQPEPLPDTWRSSSTSRRGRPTSRRSSTSASATRRHRWWTTSGASARPGRA